MAEPDFDACTDMLAYFFDVKDEAQKYAATASTGLVATVEAARNDAEGDYAKLTLTDLVEADRANFATITSKAAVRAGVDAILAQCTTSAAIDSTATTFDRAWEDLYDYMHTNSKTINSVDHVHGAFSGSVTGNGSVIRLHTDEDGYDMEAWYPYGDTYTLECYSDARETKKEGEEWFWFRGTSAGRDNLAPTGAGQLEDVKSIHAGDSKTYLLNPSFNEGSPAPTTGSPSTPTSLPGWTDDTGSFTNVQLDYDTVYRATPNDANNWSVRFTTNTYLYQDLIANNRTVQFDLPYLIGPAMYRESSCDGSLVVRVTDADTPTSGGVSRTFTISGQTNATWGRIWLVATPGANNWIANWNTNDVALVLQLTGRTTGAILLDDTIFYPMTRIGGKSDSRTGRGCMGGYVGIVGGTTPFVKGDTLTATDTVGGTRAVLAFWLYWSERGYLPGATGAAETEADR